MTRRRRAALVLAAIAASHALASNAAGDPTPAPQTAPLVGTPAAKFWHVGGPWHLSTSSGTSLDMPPAHIVDDPTWSALDLEMRRLQTAETRLTAENESFRKSAEGWRPSWWVIGSAVATGIATGWYLHSKL